MSGQTGPAATVPVAHLLLQHADRTPDAVALVQGDGTSISYGDLADRVRRLAAALTDDGFGGGTRVGLWFGEGHWIDYATGYVAALLAGAVAVVLPTDATARTLQGIAADVGLGLVLAGDGADTDWAAQVPHRGVRTSADARLAEPGTAGQLPVLADVIFTSGSTGSPKGVAASHATLAGLAHQYRQRTGGARVIGHGLSHATAVGTRQLLLAAVARGATLVAAVPLRAERFLRLAADWGVTTAVLPAAAGRSLRLALEAEPGPAPATLRSLRFVSDYLRPDLHRRLAELLPQTKVINTYGLTEGGDAHLLVTADDCHLGPGGRPAPGTQVRVRLQSGQWAPPGVPGVICLRDGNEPMTYLAASGWAPQVWSDGWTRTGDLGLIDETGRVHLQGRIESHARIGGHTVALPAVRHALEEHPAIDAAAVVALPHPSLGQSLAAVVETSAELDPTHLRAFLLRSLPEYAVPSPVLPVGHIPLSRAGKPHQEAIERIIRDHLAPAIEPCHTELEQAISGIWARVLESDREFGRTESFVEQGGDSLAALQVLAAVEELVGVEVPPETLTMTGNLGEFAAAVERLGPGR